MPSYCACPMADGDVSAEIMRRPVIGQILKLDHPVEDRPLPTERAH